jgi:HK97 family phage prohead protease
MTDSPTFMRAVPTTLDVSAPRADGRRTLSGRLVPYDVVADVVDEFNGTLDIYREGFTRGAFEGQVVNGATNKGVLSRIGLIHRHEGGLGYLGPFTALRDAHDGLYGEALVMPSKAEDVAALLDAGVDELSIEFRLRAAPNTNDVDGVRWRTRVHLDQVALEPKGAYRTAQVLQYRSEQDELQREDAERAEAERARAEQEKADRELAEARAQEALDRKRAWEEMQERIATEQDKQRQLVKDYGVTTPGGYGSQR